VAAETVEAAAPPAAGNIFTRKIGPLPGWGWMALAGAGAAGYLIWKRRQAASSAATTATTGATASALNNIQSEISALQGTASGTGGYYGGGGYSGGGASGGGGSSGTAAGTTGTAANSGGTTAKGTTAGTGTATGKTTSAGSGSSAAKTLPPGGLHTISTGSTTAKVGWDAVTGAAQYNVKIKGRGAVILPLTARTHTFTGLKANTSYDWQVVAYSVAGGYSDPASGSFKTAAAKK